MSKIKALYVALGALERCLKEYGYYEEEKLELEESMHTITLDTDLTADQSTHELKKAGKQIQETTTCLQIVGDNVQRFYEKVRNMRRNILNLNMEPKVINRVNQAMEVASVKLGETWDKIEYEEKKLEFKNVGPEEVTMVEISGWDSRKVAEYLTSKGYDNAATKAVEGNVSGILFLEMSRASVTSELAVTTSADRIRLLRYLDQIKGILHTDFVYGLALHNNYLLSCSRDNTIRSWMLKEGKLNCQGILEL